MLLYSLHLCFQMSTKTAFQVVQCSHLVSATYQHGTTVCSDDGHDTIPKADKGSVTFCQPCVTLGHPWSPFVTCLPTSGSSQQQQQQQQQWQWQQWRWQHDACICQQGFRHSSACVMSPNIPECTCDKLVVHHRTFEQYISLQWMCSLQ